MTALAYANPGGLPYHFSCDFSLRFSLPILICRSADRVRAYPISYSYN
jgi:hypothetical protein